LKRKVCVITGSRAEYGLLRWVMEGIRASDKLELQLIVTGMHLSPEFGSTYEVIEKDGFYIDKKVEMLLSSDTPSSISKSTGLALIGFADAFESLKPDLIVLLGDRFELLAAASAALFSRIRIAHIHGGETTEGAFDEAIRHSITKMSLLHFVAAEDYRRRVIQLGENPGNVHLVGGLGIDNILKLELLTKAELENLLNFKFGVKNLLITFHPVTLEDQTSESQITILLKALDSFPDIHLIFTMPNSDSDSRVIFRKIEEYTHSRPNAAVFTSLGQQRYLSVLSVIDGVVGNSSSGLIEVPSFRKATVNIGDRQKGRLMASSVINSKVDESEIVTGIKKIYSEEFQTILSGTTNPYGSGGASEKIVNFLEKFDYNSSIKKKFFDLTVQGI
jgi:GDP/UDP-N,N'-diacetylbacillosamine 2-epimerase (hydrolysing)